MEWWQLLLEAVMCFVAAGFLFSFFSTRGLRREKRMAKKSSRKRSA